MKQRAFGRMPQWVRLSEWLGIALHAYAFGALVCFGDRIFANCACLTPIK